MSLRLLLLLVLCAFGSAHAADAGSANPRVVLETSEGSITIELSAKEAPLSVANFLEYVKAGFYNGTVFHRVIPNFMIQGGGFSADFAQKKTRAPIAIEANNGLKNDVGTLAMARTSDPNSATAQFFINHKNNDFLNHTAPTPQGWGYAVFGKVVKGMDVINKIAAIPTGPRGPFPSDVPSQQIIIEDARVITADKPAAK